jgi:hypothetical protein
LKSGPQTVEGELVKRRQFKLSLNPIIYKAFKVRCRIEERKPNIVIEDFMFSCLKHPRLIDLVERVAGKIRQTDKRE